jgi:hypothetical protein
MRYILVANNLNIDKEIKNLQQQDGDNLILFNFLQPYFKYEKLQKFKNITIFSRKRSSRTIPLSSVYAGLEEIKKIESKVNKIIFHKSPESYSGNLKKACLDALKHFNFLNSPKTSYIDANHFKRIINFKSSKGLSTGLIAYVYYKLYKQSDDKILLVGFSSNIVPRFHESEWERNFFKNEVLNEQCFLLD